MTTPLPSGPSGIRKIAEAAGWTVLVRWAEPPYCSVALKMRRGTERIYVTWVTEDGCRFYRAGRPWSPFTTLRDVKAALIAPEPTA